MKRPPYLGLAIVAGIILLISVVTFRRHLPYTGTPLMPKEPPAIVLAIEEARFVGLNNNKKAWSLNADKVEIARDRTTTTLTRITDGQIYIGSKVAATVTAGKAVYSTRFKDLQLSHGVIVKGNENQKVSAQGAVWNSATSTLRSKGQVNFENRRSRISGDELTVDLKKKEMTMT